MNKDFAEFQKYFKCYQKAFGLTGYSVYFKHEPIGERFAGIVINQNDAVATVQLNSELALKSQPFKDIKRAAKHEAIHLLLARLEHRAQCRYLSEEEVYEAVEELTVKLEDLIKIDREV